MVEKVYILAIESSCDDTSAAVLENDSILSNITANQSVHQAYGGVVPELASRAHQQNIIPVVDQALKKAGINKEQLDTVAFTQGPGLLGSLLVGASFAKSFAQALGIPILAVHHMHAHIMAHFIKDSAKTSPDFPFLCLTVSGGHTQIVKMTSSRQMEEIGSTLDDAAGEAFDKAAKMLGLPYPGGPLIDQYGKKGDPLKYSFPIPKVEGLNFSFSGLKTSFLYFLRDKVAKDPNFIDHNLHDICASIQYTIVSYLIQKLKRAARETGIKHIGIAGGVSANSYLREQLQIEGNNEGWETFIPEFEYCTDNAAMIGIAGYFKFRNKEFADRNISPKACLPF